VKRQIWDVPHLYIFIQDVDWFVIFVHLKFPIEKVDVLMFPWCSHDFPIKTRRFLRGGGRRYSPGVTLTRNMRVTRGQSCWARLEWRNFHGGKSEWVWRWRVQIRIYDIMICIYIYMCIYMYIYVCYTILCSCISYMIYNYLIYISYYIMW